MRRLMHVTHISSVLVQKVSVFGSSRTSKVFHLTAEEHTDVFRYPRTQPTTSTCAYVHVHTYVRRPSQGEHWILPNVVIYVLYKPVAMAVVSLQILFQLTLCMYVASVTTSSTLWQKLQIHTTLKILSLMRKNGLANDVLSVYSTSYYSLDC